MFEVMLKLLERFVVAHELIAANSAKPAAVVAEAAANDEASETSLAILKDRAERMETNLATLQQTGLKLHKEVITLDQSQCKMRSIGTAHLVEIMNDYDLLPVKNFQYGQHEEAAKLASWIGDPPGGQAPR